MSTGTAEPVRSRLQSTLAHLWQDALEVDHVGLDDNFFTLGGDSLAAIRMLADVEDVLLAHVPFSDFLQAPTVAGLAAAVGQGRRAGSRDAAPAPVAEVAARVPCTLAQERLWFLDQAGAGAAYNLPLCARVRGALDEVALTRALREVVRRHAALRTTIAGEDGSPVQVVAPDMPTELERQDLRAHPEREAEARRRAEALVATPFDLERGPLLRAALLRLAEDEHVLALAFHHIICDGWSHAVVFRELGALYAAYARGEDPVLPAPAVQYPDFARRQRATLEPAALAGQRAWWRERLAGGPAALELATDRPRPPVLTQHGATRRSTLTADTTAGVRALARAAGATTFAALLAAYAALLSRHSGQETVMVGSTTAGRDRAELESAVGFYANTVVLRAELGGDPTFAELVGRMRDVVRDAVAHQQVPLEWLVADLGVERDAGRHPIFQVFFAQTPPAPLPIEGAEPYPVSLPGARFEIVLSVEEDDLLTLVWEYSTDLFDAATAERLDRHYVHLLEAALAGPDVPIGRLALMSEDERRELAVRSAAAAPDQPVACLHELFSAQAARTPDAPAAVHEGVMLTYGELDRRANRLAHRLRALGVGREVPVALCLERSLDMIVAVVAVLKAGGAYVPMDPENPAERLGHVLGDTGAPVLLTHERLLDRLPGYEAAVVCLDRDAASLSREPTTSPEAGSVPEDLAYVIYTSGSTGAPKGVQVEHRNVARLFSSTEGWFGFGPADTWALLHSYAFDFSVWEMWGALLHGGRLVVPSHWTVRSPEALARLLAFERVTVLNATPSLFTAAMDELLWVADQLAVRVVVFGGEALRPAALAPWFEHFGDGGPTLVNMYGITETTVHVTYLPIGPAAVERGGSPIGAPLPDLELHVLDGLGAPVPVGVPGEIHVGGAGVARGYLNRPELTAERFVANPFGEGRLYRSGDLARRLPGGGLDFLGRGDAQVKVRGYRIELGEIESALLGHDAVSEAAVIALQVGEGDTRLAAYVVPAGAGPEAGRLPAALGAHLEQHLPAHMVPASIVAVDALALTANGKLDRGALPPPAWVQGGGSAASVAPQSATEQAVAEVWREVLGIERVGAQDSFFALGGHSLLAARIATKVRDRFAIELSVRALFDHPTLAAFAARVDGARAPETPEASAGAPAGVADPDHRQPLAFGQQQLLFFDVLRPGTPVYNAALSVEVDGPLELEALRRALDGVVGRHEPLRTVFAWERDEPGQVVLTRWAVELEVVDLGHLDGPARDAELRRLERGHARRPFDLARDLMLRATVFRLGPGRHVLLLQPHHIAVDGWSVEILFSDLSELYAAERTGRAPALAPLEARYSDFARWQRERVSGARRDRDVAYWRRQLAGARDTPPLPADRPRPPEQTFEGENLVVTLPPRLAQAVLDVARAHQATPYMVLLAAFATLLYRAGGHDDILVGTPSANRGSAEFEPLVGYFTNTLVLRLRLGGNPGFADLLDRVRAIALEAFDHQELPFEQVVEAVGGRRDPGANPLFQVNFRARVGTAPELALSGTTTSWTMADIGISRFDLALEVHVGQDGLECIFEYNTELFEADTIASLAGDFEALLEHVAGATETRLLAIPLRSPEELAGHRADIRSFRRRRA